MLALLKGGLQEKGLVGTGGETASSFMTQRDGQRADADGAEGVEGGNTSANNSTATETQEKAKPDLKKLLKGASAFNAVAAFTAAGKAYRWRKHMAVTQKLDEWWQVMESFLMRSGKMEEGLNWEDYLSIFKKVYKVMVSEYDEREAIDAVRADWEHDAKGAETIGAERVRDAVFELADVWTTGATPDECAKFLGDLLDKLCKRGSDGELRFLDDAGIESGAGAELEVPEPEPDPPPAPEEDRRSVRRSHDEEQQGPPRRVSIEEKVDTPGTPGTPRASVSSRVHSESPQRGDASASSDEATSPERRAESFGRRRSSVMSGRRQSVRRTSSSSIDAVAAAARLKGRRNKWGNKKAKGEPAPRRMSIRRPTIRRPSLSPPGGSFKRSSIQLETVIDVPDTPITQTAATVITKNVRAFIARAEFNTAQRAKIWETARAEGRHPAEKGASAPRSSCFTRPLSLVVSHAPPPPAATVYEHKSPPPSPRLPPRTALAEVTPPPELEPPGTAQRAQSSDERLHKSESVGSDASEGSFWGASTSSLLTTPRDGFPIARPPLLSRGPQQRPRISVRPDQHRTRGRSPRAAEIWVRSPQKERRAPRTAASDVVDATHNVRPLKTAPAQSQSRSALDALVATPSASYVASRRLPSLGAGLVPAPTIADGYESLTAHPPATADNVNESRYQTEEAMATHPSTAGQAAPLVGPAYLPTPIPATAPVSARLAAHAVPPPPTAHELLGALASGSLSARVFTGTERPRRSQRQSRPQLPNVSGRTLSSLLRLHEQSISLEAVLAARLADQVAGSEEIDGGGSANREVNAESAAHSARSHSRHSVQMPLEGIGTMDEIKGRRQLIRTHLARHILDDATMVTSDVGRSRAQRAPRERQRGSQMLRITSPPRTARSLASRA